MARDNPHPSAHSLRRAPGSSGTNRVRIGLEQLEDRTTPVLFSAQSVFTHANLSNNGCVAVGDLNNDGKPDAVLSNYGLDLIPATAGTKVSILWGDGAGGYSSTSHISTGGKNVSYVDLGDINGDGWLDICAGNGTLSGNQSDGGSVTILLNNQAGGFVQAANSPFATGFNNLSCVDLADVNGDNKLDVIATHFGYDAGASINGRGIKVYAGDGTGQFVLLASMDPTTNANLGDAFIPTNAQAADFTGDGIVDIVVTVPAVDLSGNNDPSVDGFVYLFAGTGGGAFTNNPQSFGSGGGLPIVLTIADVDGKNGPDVIVANAGNANGTPEFKNSAIGVLINNGTGSFSENALTTNERGTFSTAVADFNLDGKLDIAAANYGSASGAVNAFVSVYYGNGNGGFVPAALDGSPFDTGYGTGGAQFVAVGDFDLNSAPDLIVAHAFRVVGLSVETGVVQMKNTSAAPASTTTDLTPAPTSASVFGEQVTFTATVSSAGGTPTGTVTFFDGANPIGTPQALDVGGVATLQVSNLSVAAHTIIARYDGATGFLTSTSSATQHTVSPAQTTVALSPTPASSVFGQSVTFTATVTAVAPGTGTPTGTVTFFDGGTLIGTPQTLNGSGVATLPFADLSVGNHSITAQYNASTNYATSTSSAASYDVAKATVGVTLGSNNDPSTVGQNVTFTATLAVNAPGAGTPTGTVTFTIDGNPQTPVSLSGLQAQFSTSSLTAGAHSVTATYNGDANFDTSTSSTLTQDVNPAANANTTTNVGTSGTPSTVTQSVTFTVTVLASAGTATGTVTLFDNGTPIPGASNLALDGGGVATFSTSNLSLGTHPITATYFPTGAFNPSNSTTLNQVVNRANTGVGLSSSSTPSLVTQSVTFTATVTANPNIGTPAGSVTFLDNGVPIPGGSNIALDAGGVATFSTSSLAIGTHTITAQYGANGNFAGSTSGVINQVVDKIGTTITSLSSNTQPASAGQTITFTATIAANAAVGVAPSGSITFKANGNVIGTAPINGTTATFQTDGLAVGTTAITAEYAGDANFVGTTSGTINQVVNPVVGPPPPPPDGTDPLLVGFKQFGVGAGAGGSSVGQFYNPDGSLRFTVDLFPGFTGGVRVTSADFNGDGVADFVAGTGPGGPSRVRVVDGVTQAQLFAIDPFEAQFVGGVYVSAGDLNGDGVPELVISPDEGGGPRVRVFDGNGFTQIADFFGIDDPNFRGGARTAVGDVNGDGVGELVIAAGFGGGPRVSVIDGRTLGTTRTRLFNDFFIFEEALRNGAFIAVGDVDGDGRAELIGGGGPGGGPRVTAYSAAELLNGRQAAVLDFFAGNVDNRGGVRLSARDLDNDAKADIVVGDGTAAGSRVTGYLGKNMQPGATPPATFSFEAFPGFNDGVYVG